MRSFGESIRCGPVAIGDQTRSPPGVPLRPSRPHPVAVLPLKLWRPRWFDGVALVLGSMAPDVAYAFDGSGWPVWPFSHEYAGLFGWCLPITLVGCWTVRRDRARARRAPPGPALPRFAPTGKAPVVGHRVVGARGRRESPAALDRLEALTWVAEYAMHVAGLVGLVRSGCTSAAAGTAIRRPSTRRPVLFWSVAAIVTLPAAAVIPLLPAAFLAHTTGVRLLCAVAAGLLAASAVVGCARPGRPLVESHRL